MQLPNHFNDKVLNIKVCKKCQYFEDNYCCYLGSNIIMMTGVLMEGMTQKESYPSIHYLMVHTIEKCPFVLEHTISEYGHKDIIEE